MQTQSMRRTALIKNPADICGECVFCYSCTTNAVSFWKVVGLFSIVLWKSSWMRNPLNRGFYLFPPSAQTTQLIFARQAATLPWKWGIIDFNIMTSRDISLASLSFSLCWAQTASMSPNSWNSRTILFFFSERATGFIASTENGYLTNRWTQFYVAVGCGKEEQRNS